MTITATQLDTKVPFFSSDARLFKLSEPVTQTAFQEQATSEFVVVSALTVDDFQETAVWLASEAGLLKLAADLVTVPGVADHQAAIEAAGWELAREEV